MLELIEITTSMHALDNDIATYQRQDKIIDGIFTCCSIERKQSGYLPFGYFPSDHRALCIDINYHKAFGFIINVSVCPNARRPQTNDPHVVSKWELVYSSYLIKHSLLQRQYKLEASIQDRTLTTAQMEEYNEIIVIQIERMNLNANVRG